MPKPRTQSNADRRFLIALARAFGGAILFALPLMMTNEMWALGVTMRPVRLTLLLLLIMPALVGLSHYVGFEPTFDLLEDVLDACVAIGVGVITSTVVLAMFGIIGPGSTLQELTAKIALQTVPASLGALLTQSQFGAARRESENRPETYGGELFIMGLGALYLAFNIAPTVEPLVLAQHMSAGQIVVLALASLAVMHAFVYYVELPGQSVVSDDARVIDVLLPYTVVGYCLVLAICGYLLWTFGRTDALALSEMIAPTIVLGFPAAIGAATARLVL